MTAPPGSGISRVLGLCLRNRPLVLLATAALVFSGLLVAPFDWNLGGLPRSPVPVDAIPDLGENQQIVFTEWSGRSPQDVEDQVTYPLTVSLIGVPGVRTVRSYSYFGFSTIYVIFEEDVDFYWSRSRILERLNTLSPGSLPEGVRPSMGPDATALGQVFWYTLEGRDEKGRPAGGWGLEELRSVQDFYVRYALASAEGVAEVASVGGYVREYQIDVDPEAMRVYGVDLAQVFDAVRRSNSDVGARTIEISRAEYVIRGEGNLQSLEDLEKTVVRVRDNVPIRLRDVSHVSFGPAARRGVLDKGGTEAVGGVVVVRYGENPLQVIENVHAKVREISAGLPEKTLADGRISRVTIVPFYDRTGLIHETLETLRSAISHEIFVTVLVVLALVGSFGTSTLIVSMLPLTILLTFLAMKAFGVDANVVALSGIAIAVGTIVDMGVVLSENMLRHFQLAGPGERPTAIIHRAASEVGGAVLTAILTTVVSFLPVFTMEAAEGKLFKPLAYTKTFTLIGSVLIALLVLPTLASLWPRRPGPAKGGRRRRVAVLVTLGTVAILLTGEWSPLGRTKGFLLNVLFVGGLFGFWVLAFGAFRRFYEPALAFCLRRPAPLLLGCLVLLLAGGGIWRGLGREFMPPLEEGSFLYMPTTMPHASLGEALDVLQKLDLAVESIPEIESAVGKIGRVESALDPAPLSMVEMVANVRPEYARDENGRLVRQWRPEIRSPDDVWSAIVEATGIPGTTSAPRLQPIAARLVMLQSGMRAPMGLKVRGPDLETIEKVGLAIEALLQEVPGVKPATVLADRIVGKPYLEIEIDREAIGRYGLGIQDVQDVIEVAVGGRTVTQTIEGRERYGVRVRYLRELRDTIESLGEILVPTPTGAQIPLGQLAEIVYRRGPQVIKSEDTFLVGFVVFDKKDGHAEVDVVEAAREHLASAVASGRLEVPRGVSWTFAGTWESQVRSAKKLLVVLPLALLSIVALLWLQFRRLSTTALVFSGVFVAWAGGFVMIWLYGQPWFLDFSVFGASLRDVFHVRPVNLSVAVWVGFLALFGIATDSGVLLATNLRQVWRERAPRGADEIREAAIEACRRRIRPCLMTTATTVLALLPVLASSGKGSEIMVPMAIPTFGGMIAQLLTLWIVPVLWCRRAAAAGREVAA